jgi:hypothetical protein
MARQELHSDKLPIEQRTMPETAAERDEGDVILVDRDVINKDYLEELKFNEEPVTIRLEPSSDVNAIAVFAVWVNGKGAEIFRNGRWYEVVYLPVGEPIVVKRKYLDVIARTKIDTIRTPTMEALSVNPDNRPRRHTSAAQAFSVLEDRNPRGAAWLTELTRRNF